MKSPTRLNLRVKRGVKGKITKERENIRIEINGKEKFGKVIKRYTQMGFGNHGKEMAVILLHDSYLNLYEAEIEIVNPKD